MFYLSLSSGIEPWAAPSSSAAQKPGVYIYIYLERDLSIE